MAVNNLNTPGVGIQPSLIDAKGDLLVGTANDAIDRLGVTGPTGSVLVTDAGETTGLKWVDPGTVGGLVHIETQDFSAVSSFSFSNDVFTDDYANYKMVCYIAASTGANLSWRGRIAGVNTTAANYNSQRLEANSTTLEGTRTEDQTSARFAQVASIIGGNAFTADIYAPYVLQHTRLYSNGFTSLSGGRIEISGSVYKSTTTQFDSLTVIASAGNITGKAILYAYRD